MTAALAELQQRVRQMAAHARTDAERNREAAPEFATFVDEMRETFGSGNVKVRWVRYADGKEQGRRTHLPARSEEPMPPPAVRRTDPATSRQAATAAKAFVSEHHQRILEALDFPATCYEIGELTGLDHIAVARRMKELCASGRAKDSGKTRRAPNGRACTVWERAA